MAVVTLADYQARLRELLWHIFVTHGGVNIEDWSRDSGTSVDDINTILADFVTNYQMPRLNLPGGPGS